MLLTNVFLGGSIQIAIVAQRNRKEKDMVNSAAIHDRLRTLGLKQKDVADATGLRQSTVSQKINNIRPMLLSEAETIANLLKIGDEDFRFYFFSQGVA